MIGPQAVSELRSLLTRNDAASRSLAVATLAGWSGEDIGVPEATSILEALCEQYPPVPTVSEQPVELFARLLWQRPKLLDADEVLRAFSLAGPAARTALLKLLILRDDNDGASALEFLFAPEGPHELLPPPSRALLSSLVDDEDMGHVVRTLTAIVRNPEWVEAVATLLELLRFEKRITLEESLPVLESLIAFGEGLIDDCDQLVAVTGSRNGLNQDSEFQSATDRLVSSRDRLSRVATLMVQFDDEHSLGLLRRMLSSADPNVSAIGAVGLVQRGEIVGNDRLEMIGRDGEALDRLTEGMTRIGATALIPKELRRSDIQARAHLIAWLSDPTELGRAPDEIEFIETRPLWIVGADDGLGGSTRSYRTEVHLFRFRLNSPHWSFARGWMIGAAGEWTRSCYCAEDEMSLDDHIETIRVASSNWPDHPGDDGDGDGADDDRADSGGDSGED
ncbi:MAG TPA: hypothetical protein VL068_01815 [Microthrixaceae bacterium]|nr:hypothetical protein [Microthrixaceae bacterium]